MVTEWLEDETHALDGFLMTHIPGFEAESGNTMYDGFYDCSSEPSGNMEKDKTEMNAWLKSNGATIRVVEVEMLDDVQHKWKFET